jgi:hypothetical protein
LRSDRAFPAELIPEQNLATANELLVDPQAVFVRTDFGAGPWWTGLQAHANRSLKNIGAKRATVYIEFDAQIAGIANPSDLIAGIQNHDFGENTNENGTFSHAQSLQSNGRNWKVCQGSGWKRRRGAAWKRFPIAVCEAERTKWRLRVPSGCDKI